MIGQTYQPHLDVLQLETSAVSKDQRPEPEASDYTVRSLYVIRGRQVETGV